MNNWKTDVPVIFIIFNRPDVSKRVFERIRDARPRQLLVISDGARPEKAGEAENVEKTRSLISDVDWNCELHTNFSDVNMGCDKRIETGITWAFQYVDRAVILEDDCMPTDQFFDFCREMLDKYEEDNRIAYISGTTYIGKYKTPYSYFFSYLACTWGWATWKSRWDLYRFQSDDFEEKKQRYLKGVYTEENRRNWLENVNYHFANGSFPWDYIWQISTEGMLRIVPSVNMVSNIGFSNKSTHTLMKPKGYCAKTGRLAEPLRHPVEVKHEMGYSDTFQKSMRRHIWDKVYGKCCLMMMKMRK